MARVLTTRKRKRLRPEPNVDRSSWPVKGAMAGRGLFDSGVLEDEIIRAVVERTIEADFRAGLEDRD